MATTVDPLADWWVHTITVEAYQGTNGYGAKIYAPAVPVVCFVDGRRRQVTDTNGDTVISESTFATGKGVPSIPLGSRVTLPSAFGGRVTTVLAASIGDTGGLLDVDHNEYSLA